MLVSDKVSLYCLFDLFNRDCLVYMFSLRFSGSKFLIILRRQVRVRKIFRTQRDLQSFHFVFEIIWSVFSPNRTEYGEILVKKAHPP